MVSMVVSFNKLVMRLEHWSVKGEGLQDIPKATLSGVKPVSLLDLQRRGDWIV